MKQPTSTLAFIIDLDGTLYDNSHRQHLLPEDKGDTAAWVAFNGACADDVLRDDIADLVRGLLLAGRECIFLTGRGEAARAATMKRLQEDFDFDHTPALLMRPMDDHRSAAEFKCEIIMAVRQAWKGRGALREYRFIAIEDDPTIVAALREIGVTTLQIDSLCCSVPKPEDIEGLERRFGELNEVVQQRNGECDRLVTEQQNLVMLIKVLCRSLKKYNHSSELVKRATSYLTSGGFISATDCLRGELSGNSEQVDNATTQFEALAKLVAVPGDSA
ncbi:HAD family acid phosphatase [Leclercia adecarboxylata]|uniref:phosphatase domain-containing protein n=1 Tax=Leclercia adecarboxylata TaxID=83655 RepID=UPI0013D1D9E4|nr:HAD family acid phosphatase [Leclercia adecarboxylata]